MTYKTIAQIDLDKVSNLPQWQWRDHINQKLVEIHQAEYDNNDRIVVNFQNTSQHALDLLTEFQRQLNAVDISNFFIVLKSNTSVKSAVKWVHDHVSEDSVPWHLELQETYNYNSPTPIKIGIDDLSGQENFLLTESKTFCIYPWIHLHAYPTGDAYPCCMANMHEPVGNTKKNTLSEIWNDHGMRELRKKMLTETASSACNNCYEREAAGFFSGRMSANKHHGHHIKKIHDTDADGNLSKFEMVYWDIRFSNLCNLSCRSCGHIFSSSWYQDQAKLAGPEWKAQNKPLNYAGRTETDIWEQLIPHLDYVEQIYFAGGEPLMMEEHYKILEELERRGRFDVRLIYNTNFTHVRLKDRLVFDYWKKFQSVSVGASLDDMGPRAEYIRKGTNWDTVENNRRKMLEICPNVDFYISPTLSILNADHICEFHRYMVEQNFIKPQDVNVNILQDPVFYRIDIATPEYKQRLLKKFEQHLEWLRPRDPLGRATKGFESSINFMMTVDNTALLDKFWSKTHQLDQIRGEDIFSVIPELAELKK